MIILWQCPFCGGTNDNSPDSDVSYLVCEDCGRHIRESDTQSHIRLEDIQATKIRLMNKDEKPCAVNGVRDDCPLEDKLNTHTPPRPDNSVCPECEGKLSFGLSADKWVCIECGLLSKEYYAE